MRIALLGLAALVLAACGDTPALPQTSGQTPVAASSVSVKVTGSGAGQIAIAPNTVTFHLDAARSMVVTLSATTQSPRPLAVIIRASLYDSQNKLVGDAAGGQVDVAPGKATQLELSGPTPTGTVAAATFEVTVVATPSS